MTENITVEELDLSVRTYNVLKRAKVNTLQEIIDLKEDGLRSIKNLNDKCFAELQKKVKAYGYVIETNDKEKAL